jgi:hypothetical protein
MFQLVVSVGLVGWVAVITASFDVAGLVLRTVAVSARTILLVSWLQVGVDALEGVFGESLSVLS